MDENKTAIIKKAAKIMGNAVSVLSMIFVLAALARIDFDVTVVTDWKAFLLVAASGVLIKTATVFLSAGAWCLWLEFFAGRRCARREALCVYAKANLGKYLPGNVMHYVGRNLFAAKLNLSQAQIAAASICEVGSLVLAAFLLGVCLDFTGIKAVCLAVAGRMPKVYGGIFWGLALTAVVCIAVAGIFFARFLRRKRTSSSNSLCTQEGGCLWKRFGRAFFPCFLIDAAVLVFLGAILAAFYLYLGGQPDLRQVLQIIASYTIAWVLGFVVPGAPGGIGVREMALTLLLSPVMGRDRIVVLGVLHRLVTVVGDGLAYFLRNLLLRKWFFA